MEKGRVDMRFITAGSFVQSGAWDGSKEILMKPSDFKREFPPIRYSVRDFDPDGKRAEREGIYLFHVLHALWHSDCRDVQKMCLRSLEEQFYPKRSDESLRSDVPHLEKNHQLAQDTIVALMVEGKNELARRLISLYVEHALAASSSDYHRNSWQLEDEELERLPSRIWGRRAVSFGMRFVVATQPSPLYRGDRNHLYLDHSLAMFFLKRAEDGEINYHQTLLFTRSYSKEMLRVLRNGKSHGFRVREAEWKSYEAIFEHAISTKGRCFDDRGWSYVIAMATIMQEREFETHKSFGPLLEQRARQVCQVLLSTERPPVELEEQVELALE